MQSTQLQQGPKTTRPRRRPLRRTSSRRLGAGPRSFWSNSGVPLPRTALCAGSARSSPPFLQSVQRFVRSRARWTCRSSSMRSARSRPRSVPSLPSGVRAQRAGQGRTWSQFSGRFAESTPGWMLRLPLRRQASRSTWSLGPGGQASSPLQPACRAGRRLRRRTSRPCSQRSRSSGRATQSSRRPSRRTESLGAPLGMGPRWTSLHSWTSSGSLVLRWPETSWTCRHLPRSCGRSCRSA
mmetsp:Transcript_56764/g.182332  ORF Transcript_56764/g.182332 Transcript_56764/m.182332 type:complete len:239 (-) Transcript_56764:239-955(-)